MSRWQSMVVASLMVLSACGGGSSDTLSTQPSPGSTAGREPPGGAPASTGASVVSPAPTDVDAVAAMADRASLSAALERTLVELLLQASGLEQALGAGASAAVDDLLRAENAAVRAAWQERGINPTAAVAALQDEPVTAGPGAARILRQGQAGTGGVLALTMSMMAAFEPAFSKQPDPTTGHLVDRVTVDTTSAKGALTLALDETADVDLALCPDEAGGAEGIVTVEVDLAGSGTLAGKPASFRASGTFSVSTKVQSDARAHLAATDGSATGTIVATSGDGSQHTWASVDGVGMPFGYGDGGAVDPGQAHGQGQGVQETLDEFLRAFVIAAGTLGMMHGKTAEAWWSKGSCVQLEVSPDQGSVQGESAEVLVTAISRIDLEPVDGTVTATPQSGSVSPESGSLPARFRLTVAPGDEQATTDLELRSFRGVATNQASIDARGFRVAIGGANQMTVAGTKCDGPVGPWNLAIGGVVIDNDFEVTFTGSIELQVVPDLSATYTMSMEVEASNLPPQLAAALAAQAGGNAVFVDDPSAPRFDLLDGDLAVNASAAGPGAAVNGLLTAGPAGRTSLAVQRAACRA